MTPAEAAVIHDHLYSVFPEEEAAKYMLWLTHPRSVDVLLDVARAAQATMYTTDYDEYMLEGAGCNACHKSYHDSTHLSNCAVATAWIALARPEGATELTRAWDAALRSDRSRASATKGAATRKQQRNAKMTLRALIMENAHAARSGAKSG